MIPFVFLNKILLKLGKENIAAGNSVIGLINESLQAAKVIISYGNKNKSLNKIGKQTENYNKTAIRQRLLQSLSSNAFKPIAILILIITFGYVGNIKANLSYLAAIFWSLIFFITPASNSIKIKFEISNILSKFTTIFRIEKPINIIQRKLRQRKG